MDCLVATALNFTSLAANGPLPTDHIPPNRVRSLPKDNLAQFLTVISLTSLAR
jgi:hypothetical protein